MSGAIGGIVSAVTGGGVQAAAQANQARMDANSIASMTMQTNNAINSMWTNVATSKINDDASAAKAIRY